MTAFRSQREQKGGIFRKRKKKKRKERLKGTKNETLKEIRGGLGEKLLGSDRRPAGTGFKGGVDAMA